MAIFTTAVTSPMFRASLPSMSAAVALRSDAAKSSSNDACVPTQLRTDCASATVTSLSSSTSPARKVLSLMVSSSALASLMMLSDSSMKPSSVSTVFSIATLLYDSTIVFARSSSSAYFVELARNNAFVGRQVGQCFGNSIQAGYYITIIFVAEITVGYRQGAVFKPVRYG